MFFLSNLKTAPTFSDIDTVTVITAANSGVTRGLSQGRANLERGPLIVTQV